MASSLRIIFSQSRLVCVCILVQVLGSLRNFFFVCFHVIVFVYVYVFVMFWTVSCFLGLVLLICNLPYILFNIKWHLDILYLLSFAHLFLESLMMKLLGWNECVKMCDLNYIYNHTLPLSDMECVLLSIASSNLHTSDIHVDEINNIIICCMII